jgi:phosphoglycolate phosphatase-like HAD superfamily hydrolase
VDCAAAKAAGFPMALVDWGYNKGRLSELEPNFVLSDIREIHQILDKISSN